jgi:hypothetical protein
MAKANNMTDKIIARILREARHPDLLEKLTTRLDPTDLQSLLLEVYRQRAQKLTPRDVVKQYEQNRFVQPAAADPHKQLEFDRLAYSLLPPDVEVMELSPVAPLGSNAAVAAIDQNNAVTTIRNTEVCSDCTNVMALECTIRRRDMVKHNPQAKDRIKLCTSQRLVRAQTFSGAATFAHFRILALCTAGQDEGGRKFETDTLVEHIDFYIRLAQTCQTAGYTVGRIMVNLTAFDERWQALLNTNVLEKLSARYPAVDFAFDQTRETGRGYYYGAGFQVNMTDPSGEVYFIADGGFTDWTQQYLSNRKERLLISGFGSERFIVVFGN